MCFGIRIQSFRNWKNQALMCFGIRIQSFRNWKNQAQTTHT
jgi:hypothetical protein